MTTFVHSFNKSGIQRVFFRKKVIIIGMICVGICYVLTGLKIYLTSKGNFPSKSSARGFIPEEFVSSSNKDSGETPIVIIAYMRSGSTLTGNIVERHPNTFYIFEPLHHLMHHYLTQTEKTHVGFKFKYLRPSMSIKNEVQAIYRAWFTCDIDFIIEQPHRYYLTFFRLGIKTNKLVNCLNQTAKYGINHSTTCTSLLKSQCQNSKHKVIKTIRTPIHWIYELMNEFPTMKIIHLVRDPRAIIASQRRFIGECAREHGGLVGCSRSLCTNMEDDLTMFEVFNKMFPGRMMRLKFEDLATDPLNTTQALYNFLIFQLTYSVKSYVRQLTMSGRMPIHVLDPVRPDSRTIVDEWRKRLTQQDLDIIQHICRYTMDQLSYNHFIMPQL